MNRDFDEWLNQLKSSISDYKYYTDFKKIYQTMESYKEEISHLNSLIKSKNIEKDFETILLKHPKTLRIIPLLLAVRAKQIYVQDNNVEFLFHFTKKNYSIKEYVRFMNETGLFDLLQNHITNNLYDYLLGIEVGLDSNGRKNRGGHLMENLVESYILKAGYEKNVNYFKEMYLSEIEKKWNLNLSAMSGNNVSTKRFDFVIKTEKQLYVIETNFYASGGSKLNETARSYKMLAEEAKKVDGVTFIWITDGLGWKSSRKNLKETFDSLKTLYNIEDLEKNVLLNLE